MKKLCLLALATVLIGWGPRAIARQQTAAARPPASDGLDVVQIRPNFHVIAGAGGNIVMQTGPEGVILVDSGSTAMADKVLAAIRRVTDLPIRYIINTSIDAEHVGGNDRLARAGLSILPGAVAAGAVVCRGGQGRPRGASAKRAQRKVSQEPLGTAVALATRSAWGSR